MNELIQTLRVLLSDTVALKFKSHGYHWNVKGDDFKPFHDFFGEIYEDYEDAVDTLAEWILKLDGVAPSDLLFFYNNSTVTESISSTYGCDMAADLLVSNDEVMMKLANAVDQATTLKQHAVANYFAERMDMHQRWHWMLSATIVEEMED
jgi:starvation-inducible DNA-binding protein